MSSETSHSFTAPSTKFEVKTPELEMNIPSNTDASLLVVSDQSAPRKRPRRTAACAAPSYVVPDSDDEAIAEEDVNYEYQTQRKKGKGKAKAESSLQVWIKHLTALLKEEEKKVSIFSPIRRSQCLTFTSVYSTRRRRRPLKGRRTESRGSDYPRSDELE